MPVFWIVLSFGFPKQDLLSKSHLLCMSYMSHSPDPHKLIILIICAENTKYGTTHYAVFSTLQSFPPSLVQILF
jgi:hypothetical protein